MRARHRDIGIVLLPGPVPEEQPATVSAADARRRRAEAEQTLRELWSLVADGLAPDARSLLVGWRGAAGAEVAAQASQRTSGVDEVRARAAFRDAVTALLARAWRVSEPVGGAPRVVGQQDGLTVEVTWWPPVRAYDVTVRTEPLAVGAEVARELMAGDRR